MIEATGCSGDRWLWGKDDSGGGGGLFVMVIWCWAVLAVWELWVLLGLMVFVTVPKILGC